MSELTCVWFVRGDQFDDLPAARARLEQLGLNRPDSSTDFQDLGVAEIGPRNAPEHPTLDLVESLASITAKGLARELLVEEFLAHAGTAARRHEVIIHGAS